MKLKQGIRKIVGPHSLDRVRLRREQDSSDIAHSALFGEQKTAINRQAHNAIRSIHEGSSEEARAHYAISETNPHCERTPVVYLIQGSTGGREPCNIVGQITTFKSQHKEFDPKTGITEVRFGLASSTAPKGAKGYSLEASWERAMNGEPFYVDWFECHATRSASITQAEKDFDKGLSQPGLKAKGRGELDSLSEAIEAIVEAAQEEQF